MILPPGDCRLAFGIPFSGVFSKAAKQLLLGMGSGKAEASFRFLKGREWEGSVGMQGLGGVTGDADLVVFTVLWGGDTSTFCTTCDNQRAPSWTYNKCIIIRAKVAFLGLNLPWPVLFCWFSFLLVCCLQVAHELEYLWSCCSSPCHTLSE